jgi:hypothetical protein
MRLTSIRGVVRTNRIGTGKVASVGVMSAASKSSIVNTLLPPAAMLRRA